MFNLVRPLSSGRERELHFFKCTKSGHVIFEIRVTQQFIMVLLLWFVEDIFSCLINLYLENQKEEKNWLCYTMDEAYEDILRDRDISG